MPSLSPTNDIDNIDSCFLPIALEGVVDGVAELAVSHATITSSICLLQRLALDGSKVKSDGEKRSEEVSLGNTPLVKLVKVL